jgi:hypothetical protein
LLVLLSDMLSPGLRQLLATKLDTFEKVELVAVLAQRERNADTIDGLARELQVGRDVLERLAVDVAKTGLVLVTGDAVRLVASPEELATIAEARQVEPRKLVSVLSSIALDRVRGRR